MFGHILMGGTLGKVVTEKRASATGQAVETPEGGRHLMRTTNVSRHRRAASRSGGATSAECNGTCRRERPMALAEGVAGPLGPERAVGGIGSIRSSRRAPRPFGRA
jgi:hypothetical protein